MIPVAEPDLSGNELKYVTECVVTEWVSSLGKYVRMFEEQMAASCQRKYAVSTSNGTTALHLALAVLGIGPGDEVIVPALTFVATANAVSYTGATPVFVDAESDYWQLDPARLEALITPRTKAIIPVDLYGHPADMDAILAVAQRHGLRVVEDTAEAHGALYKGRPCGSMGDMSCFSFYGNKVITTGEGGMLLTDDEGWCERARFLRDHAMSKTERYFHPEIGYNYRLTNIQAALGVAQLERLDTFVAIKRRNAARYASRTGRHRRHRARARSALGAQRLLDVLCSGGKGLRALARRAHGGAQSARCGFAPLFPRHPHHAQPPARPAPARGRSTWPPPASTCPARSS